MEIQNAAICDINENLKMIHVIGSDMVKIRRRNAEPVRTPFDREFEEVFINFQELKDICGALSIIKLSEEIKPKK